MASIVDVAGVTRANAYLIPPEHLQEGENSRRWADTEILELALNIADQGQLVPIQVAWRKGEDSQPVLAIVEGHRRVAAIRYINENGLSTDCPLKVRCEQFKGADHFVASASANIHRKELSPIDLAHTIATLEAGGKTRKEIAKLLGISEPLISRTLKLLTLPAGIQKDIHRGRLAASTGYDMADMTPEERTKAQESSEEAAEAKVTRKRARKAREEVSGPKPRSRKEVYQQFSEWAGCTDGTIEEPILKLCQTIVKWMNNEVGERAVFNRMRELTDSA